MMKLLRDKLLLSVIVMLLSIGGYGQPYFDSKNPPAPDMSAYSGPPPPPGLPIDDYIIPLLLVGIIYGVYKTRKIEQA